VSAHFSEFFSVRTELLCAQQGGKGPVSGYALMHPPCDNPWLARFEGTLGLHLYYIEVPVLAQISFDADDGEHLSLRAYAGPTFGFNTSAEMELSGRADQRPQGGSTRWVQVEERNGVGWKTKDCQPGALIGFSVSYALEKFDPFMDARWGRGFSTIDNSDNDLSTYNSNMALMAGFGVPLRN
jgi:hypothetical protein